MRTFLWVSAFILISATAYGGPAPAGRAVAEGSALASPTAAPSPRGETPAGRAGRRSGKVVSPPVAVAKPAPPPPSPVVAEDDFRAGMQKYYGQDHGAAVALLCRYVSLFPDAGGVPPALLVIGRGYAALKRPLPALEVFGRIIDRFPRSPEALWSVAAIADIGLENPSLKYPPFKTGAEYIRDPIGAYDLLLAGSLPPAMGEEILLRKGRLLYRQARYGEAYDAFARLLEGKPGGVARREALAAVRACAERIIDQHTAAGDPLAAVNFYFQARKSGLIDIEASEITLKAVMGLARLGEAGEAAKLLAALRQKSQGQGTAQLDQVAAEIQAMGQETGERTALPPDWSLFQSGREQLAANQRQQAEATLAKLKTPAGDSFWGKLVDYVLSEGHWREKYQRYFRRDGKS